ncbi:2,3-bisphosphoglycerate-dependent phosphoglycerate mutase 2 [Cardamine amara subsp. amara]|uniref:phosphoglycerate mutase (2,3-diphosphoglycerate-dependent) n=1 Tax=Cardamine amara subsp. amara TaxID=228776 RepID=A0ABD1AC12_CARAN
MATTMSHQAIGSIVSYRPCKASQFLKEQPLNVPMKFTHKRFKIEANASQLVDSVLSPSKNKPLESKKKSNEAALILIRHGESLWNEKNLFTGCVDVPLTQKGVGEAIEAGKKISNIPVDLIFTSSLIRAQMTAMLAMIQHRRKKVPIILHNESVKAKTWSHVFSEETRKQTIPVIAAWQLNERMYGELQGLNKKETAERYGKEKVHEWRRSYEIPPPKGESLEMCAERAVAYFEDNIKPELASGNNVMIAAHGNSLRSIIMYLDNLTSQEVTSLDLSTGVPLLYIFKEGKFMSRGSPVGPTEAGVYAYTKRLAQYRQKLDDISTIHQFRVQRLTVRGSSKSPTVKKYFPCSTTIAPTSLALLKCSQRLISNSISAFSPLLSTMLLNPTSCFSARFPSSPPLSCLANMISARTHCSA